MLSSESLMTWGWFGISGGGANTPNAPSNVNITSISKSVLLVSWEFDAYAAGFDVYRSDSASGTFAKTNITPIMALSFYDGQQTTALSADTVYYYKVQALGPSSEYNSSFSTVTSGKTLSPSESGHTYYYPETVRNVTVALLDMFDDFFIKRYDKTPARDASIVKTVRVPIMFGPNEKRHLDELRIGKDGYQAPPVPRMSLILTGIEYDPSRASGINEIRHFYDTNLQLNGLDQFFTELNPAPYNYNFTLSIQTESVSDFSQIVENILPYFNPMRYLRVKEFAFLNIERDLPVLMGGITPNFSDVMEVSDKRKIDGDIELKVQGWMYRPIDAVKIIKYIKSKYIISQFDETGNITPITATSYTINTSGDISGTAGSSLVIDVGVPEVPEVPEAPAEPEPEPPPAEK